MNEKGEEGVLRETVTINDENERRRQRDERTSDAQQLRDISPRNSIRNRGRLGERGMLCAVRGRTKEGNRSRIVRVHGSSCSSEQGARAIPSVA